MLLLLLLSGCGRGPRDVLTISAAASLTNALEAVATRYEARHPGTTVRLNLGGSAQLATQLIEGAQADLFASANDLQIERVVEAGLIDPSTVTTFATNRLVLIVPADNPAGIDAIEGLSRPGIKLVGAGESVPIGRYSQAVIERVQQQGAVAADYVAAVRRNVISEETDVRQIVAKIQLGEADAALVYASDVTPSVRDDVKQIEIPAAYNVTARFFVAPLTTADNPAGADRFLAFLLEEEARGILAEWGFGPP